MASLVTCVVLSLVTLLLSCLGIQGWGVDGHLTICRIAQPRLSNAAAAAVKQLLPDFAEGDLGSVCSWADRVRFRYHWSAPLHYIDTPDDLCNYQYTRDCKDENGLKDRCVAGAINNYTTQLLTYNGRSSRSDYNLTEALLFLSHFIGDVHQPLHVGFTSDRGGNTIDIHWYRRKTVLHHAWDDNIIWREENTTYSDVDGLIKEIQQNITVYTVSNIRWSESSDTFALVPYSIFLVLSFLFLYNESLSGVTK